MKKRFVAYALLISAVVSVTSGCMVREQGYGRGGHNHGGYHNGYNNGNGYDHGHYDDHDNRGY